MDEFDLIARYFAPLVKSCGAEGLRNDVAVLATGSCVAVSVDALVEGVHFLSDDPMETVGAKLARVNLSDLVAKGAEPCEALLSLVWPKSRPISEVEGLAAGLGESLAGWGCVLIGGDTTSSDGPLVLSLTVTGQCSERGPLLRSTARVGDDIWVTGCLGDSWLGLQARLGRLEGMAEADREQVVARYRVPSPPARAFSSIVAEFGTASIDVSDGLSGDAGHLAAQSGIRAEIRVGDVPLSPEVRRWVQVDPVNRIVPLLSGGDDYQALFTASPDRADDLRAACQAHAVAVTQIGSVVAGEGVIFRDVDGKSIKPPPSWRHSLGS